MKSTINQKLSMMAIALVVAVLGLMVLQDMKLAPNEFEYATSDEDRIEISETNELDSCDETEDGAYCIVVNFVLDDGEFHFAFSLLTKQETLGGVFDEVNEIRPETFVTKEYAIGRSLREVNGLLAPFDHTAYWSFSSNSHKDCAGSDGTFGRCNFGMDSLELSGVEEFKIHFTRF